MIEYIVNWYSQQSAAELWAVVFSLAYVYFATKQNRACWPFALLSTALYVWVFWETSLFFQSLLNAWYLIMAIYGWINWRRIEKQQNEVVIGWTIKANIMTICSLLLVSIMAFQILDFLIEQEILFLDLTVAIFSAFVTWMLAQKVLENWLYWIVINTVAMWLYWQQALYPTVALFIIYIFFAIKGYLNWQKDKGLIPSEG